MKHTEIEADARDVHMPLTHGFFKPIFLETFLRLPSIKAAWKNQTIESMQKVSLTLDMLFNLLIAISSPLKY